MRKENGCAKKAESSTNCRCQQKVKLATAAEKKVLKRFSQEKLNYLNEKIQKLQLQKKSSMTMQRKFQKVKNLCTKNSFLVVMKILGSLQPLKTKNCFCNMFSDHSKVKY